jgi:hypothetical protein
MARHGSAVLCFLFLAAPCQLFLPSGPVGGIHGWRQEGCGKERKEKKKKEKKKKDQAIVYPWLVLAPAK